MVQNEIVEVSTTLNDRKTNRHGTIACQVYSLNRKIIYAA